MQVQFRAASTVQDKLQESELRLKKLHEELASRKAELPGGLDGDSIPRILPEHNTRVPLEVEEDGESMRGVVADEMVMNVGVDDDDEMDDDEVISRDAMKRQAQSVVDAKTNKGRRKKKN